MVYWFKCSQWTDLGRKGDDRKLKEKAIQLVPQYADITPGKSLSVVFCDLYNSFS